VTNEAEVTKISRGVYTLSKNEETSAADGLDPDNLETQEIEITTSKGKATINEDSFYEPFAEWLKGAGEANEAEALGGNILKGKWGTPDVLGVLKPVSSDPN
jgi:hypothetical protein